MIEVDLQESLDLQNKLFEALEEVRRAFDKGEDDWQARLLSAMTRYCQELGAGPELLLPLNMMLTEKKDEVFRARGDLGGKPLKDTLALTVAAAAITVQHRKGSSVPEAARLVARIVGSDSTTLLEFRKRISRKSAPGPALDAYHQYVTEVGSWPNLDSLKGLCRFVR